MIDDKTALLGYNTGGICAYNIELNTIQLWYKTETIVKAMEIVDNNYALIGLSEGNLNFFDVVNKKLN